MMNKKYLILIFATIAGVLLGFWTAQKQAKSLLPTSTTSVYIQPPDLPPLPKGSAVEIPTHGTAENAAQKYPPPGGPDKILDGRADELNMFKNVNEENKKRIFAQMKAEEIASLKDSIVNDETLLKKIEKSGSGIEDYKFIKKNLEKRKKRLQVLLK